MKKVENMNIENNEIIDAVVDNQMPDYSTMSAEEIAEKIRKQRKTLNQEVSLGANQRPGFHRRIVTDSPGRIDEFLRRGWVPVKGKSQMTYTGQLQNASQMGSVVTQPVNPSFGAKLGAMGILMEIPEEIFQEDQAKKAVDQLNTEAQIDPRISEKLKQQGINGALKQHIKEEKI